MRALDDVTLEIGCAEVVAIVGPERSGKTTLLRCAAGLLLADTGLVRRARGPDGRPIVVKYLEAPAELARLCSYDCVWDIALVDNVSSDEGAARGSYPLFTLVRDARVRGAALLFASRDARPIEGLADRTLTLHRGRIVHPSVTQQVAPASRVAEESVHPSPLKREGRVPR